MYAYKAHEALSIANKNHAIMRYVCNMRSNYSFFPVLVIFLGTLYFLLAAFQSEPCNGDPVKVISLLTATMETTQVQLDSCSNSLLYIVVVDHISTGPESRFNIGIRDL